MHFHYFTLCHLRDYLNKEWKNIQILECFSQNKNELIIQSEKSTLRIGCNTPASYLVPVPDYSKAGKNAVTLMPDLAGLYFQHAAVIPYERVIILTFSEGYELIVKMHRIQGNIILKKGGSVLSLFNQSLKQDETYEPQAGIFLPENIAGLNTVNLEQDDKSLLKILREISPIFDLNFVKYWKIQCETHLPADAFKVCMQAVEKRNFYVYKSDTGIHFSLFPQENGVHFTDISEALFFYLKTQFQFTAYNSAYLALKKTILDPYKKLDGVYQSYLKSIHQLEKERSAEEIGHLLFAHLTEIATGTNEIVVEDFYHENQPVKIKLKKDLSPHENAESYYKKHKERKAKLTFLQNDIQSIEDKILTLSDVVSEFEKLTPPETLAWDKNGLPHTPLKALRSLEKQQVAERMKKEYPFRYYEKDGWEIFVGKNAKNNDALLKFSDKNDWWLHAKEVSGSHVIIRQRSGQTLPNPVLEYAAGLAAWFCKSRSQNWVPVIYTARKHVRKRKGSAAGEVVVTKERVILIEPVRGSTGEE